MPNASTENNNLKIKAGTNFIYRKSLEGSDFGLHCRLKQRRYYDLIKRNTLRKVTQTNGYKYKHKYIYISYNHFDL